MSEWHAVRTFDNQDKARTTVALLCSAVALDILDLLDRGTAPGGADPSEHPPERSVEFQQFLDWFGPQVATTIQARVVGPVVSSLSVDEDGRARLGFHSVSTAAGGGSDRVAARIKWMCEKLPELQYKFGQLYPYEVPKMMGCCRRAQVLDLEDPEDRRLAEEVLDELDRWDKLIQPGARILRGDRDALDGLAEATQMYRQQIAEEEKKRQRLDAVLEGLPEEDEEEREEALERAREKLLGISASERGLQKKREQLEEQVRQLER